MEHIKKNQFEKIQTQNIQQKKSETKIIKKNENDKMKINGHKIPVTINTKAPALDPCN
jgi:hypothetical protein